MKRAPREKDNVVPWIPAAAERLFTLVEHSDHGVKPRLNCYFLAHRLLVTEELLPCVVAQHNNVRRTRVFGVGVHAALNQREFGYVHHLWKITSQDRSGNLITVISRAYVTQLEALDVITLGIGGDHMRQ